MIKRMTRMVIVLLFGMSGVLTALDPQWGWSTHEFINRYATELLPAEMDFFKEQADYLSLHSADPDQDELPGYYHYIDIDWYPEFFEGTLPHDYEDIVALYGESVVTENGTIPWIIDQWTEELSVLMKYGEWDYVWQVAAELGHYVADAHQPLHLTVNYNGQYSDNYGVHSRYETRMMGNHLTDIPIPQEQAFYIEYVLEYTFAWIEETYPGVTLIMTADDYAHQLDPSEGSLYYDTMWDQLDSLTIAVVQKSMINLASLWQTAWMNAGKPLPPNASSRILNIPVDYSRIQDAIDVARDGDTLLVQPGTYIENLNFSGKNIIIGSLFLVSADTSYISKTTIDGNQTNSVVTFNNNENSTAVLTGFTITNGDATVMTNPNRGGGISCDHASPTLRNLIIINNSAYNGGGLNITGDAIHHPLIQNVQIINNRAILGSGIFCRGASPNIESGIIRNNTYLPLDTTITARTTMYLISCTASFNRLLIYNNFTYELTSEAESSEDIFIDNSEIKFINTVLFGNSSDNPDLRFNNSFSAVVNSIIWQAGIALNSESKILVSHSIIENGMMGIDSGIADSVIWLNGNIDADPLFESTDTGNFSLQENSPAIDAGISLLIWEDDSLVNISPGDFIGSAPDIGCYESDYVLPLENPENVPDQFILYQNYPNPFNPITTIEYEILKDAYVYLKVFNLKGQENSTLVSEYQDAGDYSINFDAQGLAAGLYFYKLQVNQKQITGRMLLLK